MNDSAKRVAIVGSGPAAFYSAMELLRHDDPMVSVDMLERLPTPYGLVRGGVAPDHEKIKSVTKIFERAAGHPRFRFFGNVEFGKDIQRLDLLQRYHAVIYAFGSRTDRHLNIIGETLQGSHAATEFVGWYNGHPDYRHHQFDLTSKRVAIIGMGNVAIDCARILCQDPENLAKTDIAQHALEALRQSEVEEVFLIGRRGPVQAAFTPAEVRELLHLPKVDAVMRASDLELDEHSKEELSKASRNTKLNMEILQQIHDQGDRGNPRKLHLCFLISPTKIEGSERVKGLELVHNEIVKEGGVLRAKATDEVMHLNVDMVFRSIGYMGEAIPGLPFDDRRGTLPNDQGQLLDGVGGKLLNQEYTAGWIKRGPSGVIGTNKQDATETVSRLKKNWQTSPTPQPKLVQHDLLDLLKEKKSQFVSFEDWKKLDKFEVELGQQNGKSRHKICEVPEMLDLIRST
ncbi:MAG: FAD-dependent oxidoreductase [Proteobacteria bacterium]|nr:FAD-dependent oxidoreductase [Pseudomonadota bacterium]MDA0856019.1 FAD-dependent oxidoreductase [Pseudomonadota bacterium]